MSDNGKLLTDGVRSMFLSTLAFALANAFVKQVSHIPAMEVVFFRCALATALCFAGRGMLKRTKSFSSKSDCGTNCGCSGKSKKATI